MYNITAWNPREDPEVASWDSWDSATVIHDNSHFSFPPFTLPPSTVVFPVRSCRILSPWVALFGKGRGHSWVMAGEEQHPPIDQPSAVEDIRSTYVVYSHHAGTAGLAFPTIHSPPDPSFVNCQPSPPRSLCRLYTRAPDGDRGRHPRLSLHQLVPQPEPQPPPMVGGGEQHRP